MSFNINVSRETFFRLEVFRRLLLQFNSCMSLISKNSEPFFWNRHVLDSLQLMSYISYDDLVLDIGTGAGFPGLILSIAGLRNVILVESNKKKTFFLSEAIKCSSNKIRIINKRVEDIVEDCDVVVSRAVASMNQVFLYSRRIRVNKKYLFLKSDKVELEILNALKVWDFSFNIYNSISSSTGRIVEVFNLRKVK